MNLSRSLKTDCEVQKFTDSGPPNHIKTWAKDRDIKVRLKYNTQSKNYNEAGTLIVADGIIYAIYTDDFEEGHRYVINSNTYSTISLVNVDNLDREIRVYVKREK